LKAVRLSATGSRRSDLDYSLASAFAVSALDRSALAGFGAAFFVLAAFSSIASVTARFNRMMRE
jgi:hypothetical protein